MFGLQNIDVYLLLTTGFSRLLNVFALLLATYVFGSEASGQYVWYLASATFIAGIAQLGIGPLVSRELAGESDMELRQLTATGFMYSGLILAVCVSFAIWVLQATTCTFSSCILPVGIFNWYLLILWGTSQTISTTTHTILASRHDKSSSGQFLLFRASITFIAVIIAIACENFSLLLSGMVIAETIVAGTAVVLVRKYTNASISIYRSLKHTLNFVRPVGRKLLFVTFLLQISSWLPQNLLAQSINGLSDLGKYGVAFRISLFIAFVPGVILSRQLPLLSSVYGDNIDGWRPQVMILIKRVLAVSLIGAMAIMLLIAFSKYLLGLDLEIDGTLLIATILMTLMSNANSLAGVISVSAGLTKEWINSDIILGFVQLTVCVALVYKFGGLGIALGNTMAFVFSTYVLRSHIAIRMKS